MTVRIVTVCTGNICRSPYAQLLLAHRLEEIRPGAFEVSSLGTSALIDQGVDPGNARLLEAAGIAYHGFLARQISEQLLADIDLVLPLTVEHRRLVLSYAPQLLKRTFTLKEMARLIASADSRRPWSERLADAMPPQERWSTITAEIDKHVVDDHALFRAGVIAEVQQVRRPASDLGRVGKPGGGAPPSARWGRRSPPQWRPSSSWSGWGVEPRARGTTPSNWDRRAGPGRWGRVTTATPPLSGWRDEARRTTCRRRCAKIVGIRAGDGAGRGKGHP